ncbi:drug/metabolite transporter (DMT)-like permease [Paenibacillus jamilae]|jgi:drug/metabolite transporter (DMT)-like permease|nr:drug/metabolite transporter (DMT)-like permease [Paenibacillus jamilae]
MFTYVRVSTIYIISKAKEGMMELPTTKKENFYFGLMMCLGMVVFMTLYNLYTNGLIGTMSLKAMLLQFILCFITAFVLELCIVGPVAKKIAFSLPYDKSKKLFVILSLSCCMVIGMVLCMSLYGLGTAYFFNSLSEGSLFKNYFSLVVKNFAFAFPLQLCIVGPLVRYLFVRFVKGTSMGMPLGKNVVNDGIR